MKLTRNELSRASLEILEKQAIAAIVNHVMDPEARPVITDDNLEYVPWPELVRCLDTGIEAIEEGVIDGQPEYKAIALRALAKISRCRTDLPLAYYSPSKGEWVMAPDSPDLSAIPTT